MVSYYRRAVPGSRFLSVNGKSRSPCGRERYLHVADVHTRSGTNVLNASIVLLCSSRPRLSLAHSVAS
jgi:hypothetical protein